MPTNTCVTFRRLRRKCQRPAEQFSTSDGNSVNVYCRNCFEEWLFPQQPEARFSQWFGERCVFRVGAATKGSVLYTDYVAWLSTQDQQIIQNRYPLAANSFAEQLRLVPEISRGRGRQRNSWVGITLKDLP